MATVRIYLERNGEMPGDKQHGLPRSALDNFGANSGDVLSRGGYLIAYYDGRLRLAHNVRLVRGRIRMMPGGMGGERRRIVIDAKYGTTCVEMTDIPEHGARELIRQWPGWIEILSEEKSQ